MPPPVPRAPQVEQDSAIVVPEPINNFVAVRKISENQYVITHKDDESKNLEVTTNRVGEGLVFQGLPQEFQTAIFSRFDVNFITNHTDVALRAMPLETKQ